MTKYSLVDLFCGCGGISRGFEWTGRFGTELGIELEPHPARAFAANLRNTAGNATRAYTGDISALTVNKAALWSELRAAGINKPDRKSVV